MSLDLSGILDAIGIIVDDGVRKAGYDKTVAALVVRCEDPDKNLYTVQYQDSTFKNVQSYNNNEVYQENELVYLTIPSNNSSAKKYILGRVSSEVRAAIDASYAELDNYLPLGVVDIDSSSFPKEGIIFDSNATEQDFYINNNKFLVVFNGEKIEVPKDEEEEQWNKKLDEINESLRAAFLVSPYFIFEYDIRNEIKKGYLSSGNFGFKITLNFKIPQHAVSEDGDETTYPVTYTIDINKMTGQPYSYKTDSHQHTIFKVDNAKDFDSIGQITFFAKNFDDSDAFWISNMSFYGATKKGEQINKYNLKIGADLGRNYIGSSLNRNEAEVRATLKIGDEDFTSKEIKYYWFREDLTVRADSSTSPETGYSRYTGDGWKCLNETQDIEAGDQVAVYDYKPYGQKESAPDLFVFEDKHLPLFRNRIKCIAIYFDKIIESNVIEIINKNKIDYKFSLASYIRPTDSADINYADWSRKIKNATLQWVDYSAIVCEQPVDAEKPEGVLSYIWQVIDNAGQVKYIDLNSNLQYIYGYQIKDTITYKCAVFDNNNCIDIVSIVLNNIDNEMRNNFSFKSNIFNALTNNGTNDGIYYAEEKYDEEGNLIGYNTLSGSEEIDKQKNAKLFINATWITSGHLDVPKKDKQHNIVYKTEEDENGKIVYQKDEDGNPIKEYIFYADIDQPDKTQIGGFMVTERAIYNGISENTKDATGQGVYLGIDGLFIGATEEKDKSGNIIQPANYIKAYQIDILDENNKPTGQKKWELDITGKIDVSDGGKIANFTIENNALYSFQYKYENGQHQYTQVFGIDTNSNNIRGIWLGGSYTGSSAENSLPDINTVLQTSFENAKFSVDKKGILYAQAGKIANFDMSEVNITLSSTNGYFNSNSDMIFPIKGSLPKGQYDLTVEIHKALKNDNTNQYYIEPISERRQRNNITLTEAVFDSDIDLKVYLPYTEKNVSLFYDFYDGHTIDDNTASDVPDIYLYPTFAAYHKSNSSINFSYKDFEDLIQRINKGEEINFVGRNANLDKWGSAFTIPGWGSGSPRRLRNYSLSQTCIFAYCYYTLKNNQFYELKTEYFYIELTTVKVLLEGGILKYQKEIYDDEKEGLYLSPKGLGIGKGYYLNSNGLLYVNQIGKNTLPIGNIYVQNLFYRDSSAISSSDENLKNSIYPIYSQPLLSKVFDSLQPVSFKYNNGESGRTHFGLIANEVKNILDENDISTIDFAPYCEWITEEGNYTCGLRYEEFIALNIAETQKLKERVAILEERLKEIKGDIT